jgi:outer membrane protein assembly factor BamA
MIQETNSTRTSAPIRYWITAVVLFICLWSSDGFSQISQDPVKLPFSIADEKRLSDEDLRNKKEGHYITGAPEVSSDPINGFGYGAEGSIYFNGKRSDPFFDYTAYRAKIAFVVFNTTKNEREFLVNLDVPYIFNSKWRLRVDVGYEADPNLLYFGVTEKSLSGLSYYPNGDSSKAPLPNVKYSDYQQNALVGENQYYNTFFWREGLLNVTAERSYFDSKVRALVGFEIAHVNMTTFQGNSLLRNDVDQGKTLGLGKGWLSILQAGLVYDTRDLEPDPSHGIFAEVTNELSLKSLGSRYNFNKTFINFSGFNKILPSVFDRLIFAGRISMGYLSFDGPFFEYQDQWSSEGSIEGLGGSRTLRGFKQGRFVARAMSFTNFELRWRFAQTELFNQHFAFSAVPFFDTGGVWDKLSNLNFNNLRYSEGLGLRIAWNVSTILRFDYAISKEDKQFFFNLSHAF